MILKNIKDIPKAKVKKERKPGAKIKEQKGGKKAEASAMGEQLCEWSCTVGLQKPESEQDESACSQSISGRVCLGQEPWEMLSISILPGCGCSGCFIAQTCPPTDLLFDFFLLGKRRNESF